MAKPVPASIGKLEHGQAEEPGLVLVGRHQREVDPAEGQREGDRAGQDHAPEDAHVHQPALATAPRMKVWREDVGPPGTGDEHRVLAEVAPGEEVASSPPSSSARSAGA